MSSLRPVGSSLGPYVVEAFLAEGGMGAVYEATDARTGGRVALKVLTHAAAQSIDRFQREARLSASLSHPNIVKVHEWACDGGAWYMAMELLRGVTLAQRIAAGPLPLPEVLRVAAAVCEALVHAHAQRVVHRDLTPANIFLTDDGGVRVLDFGIARAFGDTGLTRTGNFLGTVRYVSPEQVVSAATVDRRADLWTLGVVLYECLSGRHPFEAENHAALLLKITSGEPRDLTALCPWLPRAMTSLVRAALTRDRDARIGSAEEFLDRLRAVPEEAAGEVVAVPADDADEERLVSAVLCLDVRDEAAARALAGDLGGDVTALSHAARTDQGGRDGQTTSVLAVFGAARSFGDEPVRACRLGRALELLARTVVVVTGRGVARAEGVSGAVIDAAFALAQAPGVVFDATTRALVHGVDGGPRVDAHAGTLVDESVDVPFVGREAELSQLTQLVASASSSGIVSTAVVSGPPGVGKSRLRREAARRVKDRERSATVVTVRGDPMREGAPLAVLRDALRDVVGDDAASALLPRDDGDPQAQRDRCRHALLALLQGLAERGPVVLAVDDAQWLDPASQQALRWICEAEPFVPLALWFFAHPQAEEALSRIRPTEPDAARAVLALGPLGHDDARRILHAIAPGAPDAVIERAGAVPLFVEEFARRWGEQGEAGDDALPATIELLYQSQLDQRAALEKDLLKRAAVFGRTFWVDGVAALGAEAVDPRRLGAFVSARPRGRFEGHREFVFRSALMQEVALRLWTAPQRAQLHARAAQWLGERGADATECAFHWERAGEPERAAGLLVEAAERSSRVSDATATASLAARALAITANETLRWRALVARDRGLQLDGDRAVQRAGLEAMEELAPALGIGAMAECAWRWCYFLRVTGELERAVSQGHLACDLALAGGAPSWHAAALNDLALLHADAGRTDEGVRCAREACEIARGLDDVWWGARTRATLGYARNEAGEASRALDDFHAAAQGFHAAGDLRLEGLALANAAYTLMRLGRLSDAADRFDDVLRRCKEVGNLRTMSMAWANRATIHRVARRFEQARADLDAAEALARRIGHPRIVAAACVERVYLALAMNDEVAWRELGDAALAAGRAASALPLEDSARAVALRAMAQAGAVDATLRAEVEAAAARTSGEAHLELLAALDVDASELRSACAAAVEALGSDDAQGCAEGMLRRFEVSGEGGSA